MDLLPGTIAEIDKLYHGRKHVKLTIGIRQGEETRITKWGPNKEEMPYTEESFPVGSICKLFNGVLLAKYVSEGKLDLKASIDQYIPDLPSRYYPSLEKLATHTSGYTTQPYTFWTTLPLLLKMNQEDGLLHKNPFRGYPTEEDMLKILKDVVLTDRPYKFVYSNIGMGILGYILGKVSKEGYWDTMNRFIQEELHLSHTFLGNVDMVGYDKKDQACRPWQWEKTDVIAPAGALNASIPDLLTFGRLQTDGTLPYVSMCHEIHGPCEKNADSGLAWRLEKDIPVSWHTGAAGAFNAFLGVDRETKTVVAVTANYGLVNAEQIGFSVLRGMR